jgi:hypothetical protein
MEPARPAASGSRTPGWCRKPRAAGHPRHRNPPPVNGMPGSPAGKRDAPRAAPPGRNDTPDPEIYDSLTGPAARIAPMTCPAGIAPFRFVRLLVGSLLLVLAAGVGACDDDPAGPDPPGEGTITVLILGNSLTYTNNLPVLVDSLAAASGIAMKCTGITDPGYGLIDHYVSASRRAAVLNGHFDFVVLQQGPSANPDSRDSLQAWAKLWEPLIQGGGSTGALYAVWPEADRFNAFADVSTSYRLAAGDIGALFIPVGDSWLETWSRIPDAPLYGRDLFHPSIAGSYVAAVAIVSMLADVPAVSLSPRWLPRANGAPVDSTLAATIRQSVDAVVERNRTAPAD